MKTYNFGGYFVTTSEILEGYISAFDVTPEEVVLIELGANLIIDNETLVIEE